MAENLINSLKELKIDKKENKNFLNIDLIHSDSDHSFLVPKNKDAKRLPPLPFQEFPESNDSPFHEEFYKISDNLTDMKLLPIFRNLLLENVPTFETKLSDVLKVEDLELVYKIEKTPTIGNPMLTFDTIKKRKEYPAPEKLIDKEHLLNLLTINANSEENSDCKKYQTTMSNSDFVKKMGEIYDNITAERSMTGKSENLLTEEPIQMDENYNKACELLERSIAVASNKPATAENVYFKMIDIKKDMEAFEKLRPKMVLKFPFELDDFQKQAILMIEKQENVLVAAHTSAGKTVVAEYAIASSNELGKKSIYTSPIKALSNQKFYEFKRRFGDVGIVTGDVTINDTAQTVIMTTEILRSMLYRGGNSSSLSNVRYVIFDEVHYLNDEERGVVWEELFIMLPKHIKLILLSATIPNCHQVANWIGKIREQMINVIITLKRPVPLEHFFYFGDDYQTRRNCLPIINSEGVFLTSNFLKIKNEMSSANSKQYNRQKKPRYDPKEKQRYLNLIQYLKEENKLPTIIFIFSKDQCFKLAQSFGNLDLTTKEEKFLIHTFFKNSIARLSLSNQNMTQVQAIQDICIRGLAVHHSGVLPLLREIVELLFHKGYIKVLLATETFAMGVNMPAKAVVFSALEKYDNNGKRDLLASEYIQMAGRAGRRGQDIIGSVYVMLVDEPPPQSIFLEMAAGKPLQITSKFKLTYGMILNLLATDRGTNTKVAHMMQSSFSEYVQYLSKKDTELKISNAEKAAAEHQNLIVACSHCSKDLLQYNEQCSSYFSIWGRILSLVAVDKNMMQNMFCPGRIVLICTDSLGYYRPAIVADYPKNTSSSQASFDISNIEVPMIFLAKKTDKFLKYMFENIHGWPIIIDHKPCFGEESTAYAHYFDVCINKIIYIFTDKIKCNFKLILSSRSNKTPNSIPLNNNPEVEILLSSLNQITKNIIENNYNFFNIQKYELKPFKNTEESEFIDTFITKFNIICTNLSQSNFECIQCPTLQEHCSQLLLLRNMNKNVADLKSELSDGNLIHMPEYFKRIKVLQKLELIDSQNNLTLKGKVALKFTCESEVILAELLFNGTIKSLSPPQLAAMLSCLLEKKMSKKEDGQKIINYSLESVLNKIEDIMLMIDKFESECDLMTSERFCDPRLMEGIYEWSQGATFDSIVKTSKVQEGNMIRFLLRLDEVCKELEKASLHMGNLEIIDICKSCRKSICRDIVLAPSLYIT